MSGSRVVRKAPVAMFGLLLCLGALLVSGLFSARAAVTKTGTLGDCTWEYVDEGGGELTFRLYPTNGVEGTASWTGGNAPWNHEDNVNYYRKATRVIIDKPVRVTSAAGMFWGFYSARAMDLSGLITDDVQDMSQMFMDCTVLTSLNLRGLKTNKVTDMTRMFLRCVALKHIDVTGWDMSNVKSLHSTFEHCEKLEKITGMETWTWDSGTKLESMEAMFAHCKALKEVDVSSFKTDNLTTLKWAFADCSSLTFLDVSNWNVEKVENLYQTFMDCSSLKEIRGIDSWEAKSLKNVESAFEKCYKLKELDLDKWNVSACKNLDRMFFDCKSLERLEVNEWDVSKITSFNSTFMGCSSLMKFNVGKWKMSVAATTFKDCFNVVMDDVTRHGYRYFDMSGAGWDSSLVPAENMFHIIGSPYLSVLTVSNQMNLDKHTGGETFVRNYAGSAEYTGSKAGTVWQRVDETNGGTVDKPVGQTFSDLRELGRYNTQYTAYHIETYVRVSPSQYFLFDKNLPEATGTMDSQIIAPNAKGNIKASTFSYPGHRVVSWNTQADGMGKTYNIGQEYTNPDSNNKRPIVLYAQWETNHYTIAFNSNAPTGTTPGGVTMPPKSGITHGEKVQLPKNTFTISGHDFAGWTLNKEGTGTIYADEEEVSDLSNEEGATITLYAQWFKHGQKYTIKFEQNKPADATSSDGKMPDQEVIYGQDDVLNKNKFKCGDYGFVGWGRTANATEKDSVPDGARIKNVLTRPSPTTITLYAQWNKRRSACTIAFNENSPKEVTATGFMRPIVLWQNEEKALPANNFSCTGYTFLCWTLDKEGIEGAYYKDKQKITSIAAHPSQDQVTLYAQWIRNDQPYTITFDSNGPGDSNPQGVVAPKDATYGEDVELPKEQYECTGYDFLGWSRTKDDSEEDFFKSGATVKNLVVRPPQNAVTLYAQWVKHGQPYTIAFDKNNPNATGGTDSVQAKHGEPKELPASGFSLSDHTFLCWSTEKTESPTAQYFQSHEKVSRLITRPSQTTVMLYAQWIKNGQQYTISFDKNEPEKDKIQGNTGDWPAVYGQDVTLPPSQFFSDDYAFLGWSRKPVATKDDFFKDEATVRNLVIQPPVNKVVLYAQWVKNGTPYNVKFDKNYPSDVVKPAGGMDPERMEYGTEKKLDKNMFTCENYTFLGWSREKVAMEKDFFEDEALVKNLVVQLPFDEVTLYAQWIKAGQQYKVAFNRNDPSDIAPGDAEGIMGEEQMEYGKEKKLTKNAFKIKDQAFLGWSRKPVATKDDFFKDEASVKNLIVKPPFGKITLYAQWIKNGTPYDVNFDKNYPSDAINPSGDMSSQQMEYGTEKKLDKNVFSCDNYAFLGWSREKTATEEDFFNDEALVKNLIVQPPFNEVTLYAQWIKKGASYKVVFEKNAPKGISPDTITGVMPAQELTYGGDAVKLDKNLYTLADYTFLGWSRNPVATEDDFLKDENEVKDLIVKPPFDKVTLYAQWIKKGTPYDVIFDANYPSEADDSQIPTKDKMGNQQMKYDQEEKLNKNKYTCPGYTFLGWSRIQDGMEEDFLEDQAVVKNLVVEPSFDKITLFAQWVKDGTPYDVIFDPNYPSASARHIGIMENQPMQFGKEEKLFKNEYVCSGYTFLGWSRIKEGSEQDFFEDEMLVKNIVVRPPINRVTLYAQWGVGTRITYSAAKKGGSVSRAYEVIKDGAEPKGSTAQPDDDYHFVKWTCDIDPDWLCTKPTLGKDEIEVVAQADDGTFLAVNFKAHFRSNSILEEDVFTVTFDKNDSRAEGEMGDATFLRDYPATLPLCTFTREGYEFTGWNTKADGTGTSFADEAGINFDGDPSITLYAQWEKGEQVSAGSSDMGGRGVEDVHSGWERQNDRVYYYKNGQKLTGWQELSGTAQDRSSEKKSWFYFDNSGAMLTGRHKLVGGTPNPQGVQEEHWFGFDENTGAQVRYWQKIGSGADEKWYYYRPEDGAGLIGKHQIVGGFKNAQGVHELNWFYFDTNTGAEVRGWHKTVENGVENWYYYRDGDGIMLKGQHKLVGGLEQCMNWFYFDEATGAQIRGWKYITYQNKWCYYRGSDGIMLKGQHELEGGDNGGMNWFYFDEATGAELRNTWKEIPSQEKTCYYGSDGAMYKGQRTVGDKDYYFDEETGAVREETGAAE